MGIVSLGLTEIMRHKGHDKELPCPNDPLFSLDLVHVSELSISDVVLIDRKIAWLDCADLSEDVYYFNTVNSGVIKLSGADAVYRIINI